MMVISEKLYKKTLKRASETMLAEWVPSHKSLISETEARLGCEKGGTVIYASSNEHDIWMLWLYLKTRGHSGVYITHITEEKLCVKS